MDKKVYAKKLFVDLVQGYKGNLLMFKEKKGIFKVAKNFAP